MIHARPIPGRAFCIHNRRGTWGFISMAKNTSVAKGVYEGMGTKPGAATLSPLPNVRTYDYEADKTVDAKVGPRFTNKTQDSGVSRIGKIAGPGRSTKASMGF